MLTGLSHVTITVPEGTLDLAHDFYTNTLGLTSRPVPILQRGTRAWFDIGTSGQQMHVALGDNLDKTSIRHHCFVLESQDELLELQARIWEHFARGGKAAPMSVDRPGDADPDGGGEEYPERFFARDYAGNRLEFSL